MGFMDILEKEIVMLKNYDRPGNYILTPRAFTMDAIWEFRDYLFFLFWQIGVKV